MRGMSRVHHLTVSSSRKVIINNNLETGTTNYVNVNNK